jgi:two-component system, sensor histidine kinase and response regulator
VPALKFRAAIAESFMGDALTVCPAPASPDSGAAVSAIGPGDDHEVSAGRPEPCNEVTMRRFDHFTGDLPDVPLRVKLRRIMLLCVAAGLSINFIAFTFCELTDKREDLISQLDVTAQVVGANSRTALASGDAASVSATLSALVRVPAVTRAWIQLPGGGVFAAYPERTPGLPALRGVDAAGGVTLEGSFWSRTLLLARPVVDDDGERLGTIVLSADLGPLWQRGSVTLVIDALAAAVAFLVAYWLSARLLRRITGPVQALTESARRVVEERHYDVTVPRYGNDEIGLLTDRFNAMLREIALRDEALRSHRDQLETEVALRTVELQAAKALAEAANEAKGRFLANMNHEMRTPVNGVLGLAELLERSVLDDRQRRHVGSIATSAETLLRLFDDILDFSGIEAGALVFDHVPFDPRGVFEDVTARSVDDARRKGVALALRVHPSVPPALTGDPLRLRQVLEHLVSNAVKFTEEGEVLVDVSVTPADNGVPAGRVIVLVNVVDTGAGIATGAQAGLFDAFTQADSSSTRRFGGTGLGLALTRGLVVAQNGSIGFSSVPGHGSRFWLTLPYDVAVPDTGSAPPPLAGRVLLVEPDACSAATVQCMLDTMGVACETCSDNGRALKALTMAEYAGTPFSLVLCAQRLPDSGALAFAERLQAIFIHPPAVVSLQGCLDDDLPGDLIPRVRKPVLRDALRKALGAAPTMRSREPEPATPVAVRAAPNILLVEDHPVNREISRDMLSEIGCRVVVAENGVLALEAVARETFDLVLMDCQMPVMDGFQATRRIRDIEHGKGRSPVPVIALTANALSGDREDCLAAGMTDYMPKPLPLHAMKKMMERHVPGYAGPQAAAAHTVADVPASTLIDESQLFSVPGLRRNTSGLMSRMIALYRSEADIGAAAMRDAQSLADATALRAAAHRLKSSSGALGATCVYEFARGIENAARAGRTEFDASAQAALERMLQQTLEALEALEALSGAETADNAVNIS